MLEVKLMINRYKNMEDGTVHGVENISQVIDASPLLRQMQMDETQFHIRIQGLVPPSQYE